MWSSAGVWSQQGAKLVGTGYIGPEPTSQGNSVALSADGNTLIEGGPYDNGIVGATWIFTRSGGSWSQQGNKLVGTGNFVGGNQGSSVSLSADGNTAMVGGHADNSRQGAAWVYTRSGGEWSQLGNKLVGTGNSGGAELWGTRCLLSADGNTAMVGGYNDNNDQGAVHGYIRAAVVYGASRAVSWQVPAIRVRHNKELRYHLSADGTTAMVGGYR